MEIEGENKHSHNLPWQSVRLPEGCTLVRKHSFEYTTAANLYDLDLYEHQDGTWHAIALPRGGSRVIIYGSNIVNTPQMAIQVVVDKIRREGLEAWDEPTVTEEDSVDDVAENDAEGC